MNMQNEHRDSASSMDWAAGATESRSTSDSSQPKEPSSAASTSEAFEAIQKQYHAVKGELVELARLVRGGAHATVASAVDRADDARTDTVDRAKDLEHQAAAWIKERPLQASLVSMGVGALLWSLVRRS